MEKQILDSPFTKKEYLNLVKQFNDEHDKIFHDFAISGKTIVNIGNRDFVDYRPTSHLSSEILEDNAISKINLDSLHFFQIQQLLENEVYFAYGFGAIEPMKFINQSALRNQIYL